jgi:hypothetical protein
MENKTVNAISEILSHLNRDLKSQKYNFWFIPFICLINIAGVFWGNYKEEYWKIFYFSGVLFLMFFAYKNYLKDKKIFDSINDKPINNTEELTKTYYDLRTITDKRNLRLSPLIFSPILVFTFFVWIFTEETTLMITNIFSLKSPLNDISVWIPVSMMTATLAFYWIISFSMKKAFNKKYAIHLSEIEEVIGRK